MMDKRERINLVIQMRESGATLEAIAQVIGVTRQRINQITKAFNVSKPPKPQKVKVTKERHKQYWNIRSEVIAQGLPDPLERYRSHRHSAARRGIPFKLTFLQWWDLWEEHYWNRSVRKGGFVMCRYGDAGAYEVGNVRIDAMERNHFERGLVQRFNAAREPQREQRKHSWQRSKLVADAWPNDARPSGNPLRVLLDREDSENGFVD